MTCPAAEVLAKDSGEVAFWSGSRDLKSRFSSLPAADLPVGGERRPAGGP